MECAVARRYRIHDKRMTIRGYLTKKEEYDKISQTDTDYILLSDDAIAYITAKGLRKYFKD